MKTTVFKAALILLLSFAFFQNSNAYGRYYPRCERRVYYAPRYYAAPRYVPAPCYRAVFVPGHWVIDRFGVRVWVAPCYR